MIGYLRDSRPEVFYKKGVLRNFTKLTVKHLCQSLFFNKAAGPATLLKKRLWRRCFPVNFAKFPRTPFLTENLRWLLLIIQMSASSLLFHAWLSYEEPIFFTQRQIVDSNNGKKVAFGKELKQPVLWMEKNACRWANWQGINKSDRKNLGC